MAPRIIALLIGYAFGLIQTAFLYGKRHGIDIRTVGSGNAGTTNALRTFGKHVGILVFLGDCLKAVCAIVLVSLLFRTSDILPVIRLYAGIGAIAGHNYPFYMSFKGGKGVACTAGVIIAFSLKLTIAAAILFFGSLALTNYVSLGSLLIAGVFFIGTVILGQTGQIPIAASHLPELYILAGIISGSIFFRHRSNITRLMNGTERKTYLFRRKEK
jgi:glycerol-3-phosphate acyltransferase PlsY